MKKIFGTIGVLSLVLCSCNQALNKNETEGYGDSLSVDTITCKTDTVRVDSVKTDSLIVEGTTKMR